MEGATNGQFGACDGVAMSVARFQADEARRLWVPRAAGLASLCKVRGPRERGGLGMGRGFVMLPSGNGAEVMLAVPLARSGSFARPSGLNSPPLAPRRVRWEPRPRRGPDVIGPPALNPARRVGPALIYGGAPRRLVRICCLSVWSWSGRLPPATPSPKCANMSTALFYPDQCRKVRLLQRRNKPTFGSAPPRYLAAY